MKLTLLALLSALTVFTHAQEIKTERDVEYGRVGDKPLLLDVTQPAAPADKPRPAIISVHGGGWVGGDKKDMHPICEGGARTGYVVFNVNYRLTFGAENRWPAALDDVQRAVRWVRANAAKYNVDPARLGAIGASAGGHLVTFLGTTDTRDNSDKALAEFSSRVQCVVDIFGPTDLTEDFVGKVKAGLAVNDLIRQFLGKPQQEAQDLAKDASPLWRVNAKSAPFLIFHGSLDELVPQSHSERLDAALKRAGVESKLIIFPDEGHGWRKKENNEVFAKESVEFFLKHLVLQKK